MKTKLFTLLLFVAVSVSTANAQSWKYNRNEVMFGIGSSNFLGELGGANQIGTNFVRDLDFPTTRTATCLGYRYRLGYRHAVSVNLTWGVVSGDDKQTEEPIRNYRNLNFKNNIWELSGRYEFIFYQHRRPGSQYRLSNVKGWKYQDISLYGFVGIGGMHMNPKGQDADGNWVELKPLRTEGQGLIDTREEYSLWQVVIPYGIGMRYGITKKWTLGLEFGARKTFTDYIDDVSTTYYDFIHISSAASADGLDGNLAVYMADPSLYAHTASAEDVNNAYSQTLAGQQRGDRTDKDSYMFLTISVYYRLTGSLKSIIPSL